MESCIRDKRLIFVSCYKRKLGDGVRTRFCEDLLFGDVPFLVKYARLYNHTFSKHISIAKAFEKGFSNIRFRRLLCGQSLVMWKKLLEDCSRVVLSEDCDRLVWLLSPSGVFSVKSFYNALRVQSIAFPYHFYLGC